MTREPTKRNEKEHVISNLTREEEYDRRRQPQYAKDGGIYSKLTGVLFVFVFLFSVVALYLLVKELATMSFLDFTR